MGVVRPSSASPSGGANNDQHWCCGWVELVISTVAIAASLARVTIRLRPVVRSPTGAAAAIARIHGRAFYCPTWRRARHSRRCAGVQHRRRHGNISTRVLARSESTLAMLFYSAVVGAVLFGACAPWFWGGERPTLLTSSFWRSAPLPASVTSCSLLHTGLRQRPCWHRCNMCSSSSLAS